MPSRKIITTLILCLAGIASVWLIEKSQPESFKKEILKNSISAVSNENTDTSTSTEWKRILISLDKKSQDYEDLTKNNDEIFDDTTLTAQMSRDFMSQYLILKKGGKEITQEDIDKITQNTLAGSQYNSLTGPVYIYKNIKIVPDTATSLRKYKNDINLSMKNRSLELKENPTFILSNSAKTNDPALAEKLDVMIKASKGFIGDGLAMEVPSSAVSAHLNIINSVSNIVASVEAMKTIYNDPVMAMMGLSQYNKYMVLFQQRLEELNSYLYSIK